MCASCNRPIVYVRSARISTTNSVGLWAWRLIRRYISRFAPSGDENTHLQSLTFDGEVSFALGDVPDKIEGDWGNFPRGAVRALQQRGHKLARGITGITAGRMHEGGLSSSAAIGVAYLLAYSKGQWLVRLARGQYPARSRPLKQLSRPEKWHSGSIDNSLIAKGISHCDRLREGFAQIDSPVS